MCSSDLETELEQIPVELRGLHHRNPVNLPPGKGVQIELPPRIRGRGTKWVDWEGPDLVPHTVALIDGLPAPAQGGPAPALKWFVDCTMPPLTQKVQRADFARATPKNLGTVNLKDFLPE